MKPKFDLADLIKVFAVITAMPRWVGALLAAEGFPLPETWLYWWIPVSAIMSAGMAIVEGLAFSYVFTAWRNQRDKTGDRLFWFALASAALFVGVLAPYIAAQVQHVALSEILKNGLALASWSIAVGASTIAIVASVGYAQKQSSARKNETPAPASEPPPARSEPEAITSDNQAPLVAKPCQLCDYVAVGKTETSAQNRLNGHARVHKSKPVASPNGKVVTHAEN